MNTANERKRKMQYQYVPQSNMIGSISRWFSLAMSASGGQAPQLSPSFPYPWLTATNVKAVMISSWSSMLFEVKEHEHFRTIVKIDVLLEGVNEVFSSRSNKLNRMRHFSKWPWHPCRARHTNDGSEEWATALEWADKAQDAAKAHGKDQLRIYYSYPPGMIVYVYFS